MSNRRTPMFYGWWIVLAAFLNLFFSVGIIFYGFPVFYAAFVETLGFTRAQVTQGFLLGFIVVGLPFGLLAGALIDRIGPRASGRRAALVCANARASPSRCISPPDSGVPSSELCNC